MLGEVHVQHWLIKIFLDYEHNETNKNIVDSKCYFEYLIITYSEFKFESNNYVATTYPDNLQVVIID